MMDSVRRAIIWRSDLLKHRDSLLSFRERLMYAVMVDREGKRAGLVLNPIRRDNSGIRYLAFARFSIYFDLDFAPKDEESFMDGITELLKESFIYPTPYFASDFRPKPGETAFDVGANIGPMTLLMSRMVGPSGRVFCFEPAVPKSLQMTLTVNHLDNCQVIPKAVSDSNGSIEMRVADASKESNIIGKAPPDGIQYTTRVVETTTLDDFVESKGLDRVDFVTMDIEGAEEMAVKGARRTIERFHPKLSIASYHKDLNDEPQHPRLVRLLKDLGYQVKEQDSVHILAF
jgi:FkbM family methyltransferase